MPAPVKHRITAAPAARPYGLLATGRHCAPDVPATVQVLDTQPGAVGWLDKAKAYYKALIALVGVLLTLLMTVTLPDPLNHYISAAVGVLTVVLTALKANETWIDGL